LDKNFYLYYNKKECSP